MDSASSTIIAAVSLLASNVAFLDSGFTIIDALRALTVVLPHESAPTRRCRPSTSQTTAALNDSLELQVCCSALWASLFRKSSDK